MQKNPKKEEYNHNQEENSESDDDDVHNRNQDFEALLSRKDTFKSLKTRIYKGAEESQQYDEVLSEIFEKIAPGEGDEFQAVKPWLGAIKKPKNHPRINKHAPDDEFVIDWVYGYRSEEARQNCFFNSEG